MIECNDIPIFCDDCPELALALLDGAPLCDGCLTRKVFLDSSRGLITKIEPLRFSVKGKLSKQVGGCAADAA